MSRRWLLVLALGGCDRAFGLDRDRSAVCGPFGVPEEVVFSPALGAAHDLSIDASGLFGMVHANLGNGATTAWRGPHAVVKDGSGMWTQDVARDQPVLNSLDGAHITASGTGAVGWIDLPRGPIPGLLSYGGTAWDTVVGEILDKESEQDLHFGNVIDLPVASGLVQRFAVELRLPLDGKTPRELRILQRIPTSPQWTVTEQAAPLAAAKPVLDVTGGVLTADHEILVYTAVVGDEDRSRAFASRRTKDRFGPGVELDIDGLPAGASITEPWINADCTQLHYREGETTWVTNALP